MKGHSLDPVELLVETSYKGIIRLHSQVVPDYDSKIRW